MAKRKKLPLVAICGRPNVGKSTLYNRILGKARAIVHDEEGITRDRHEGVAKFDNHVFRIVDTGGIVENPIDSIVKKMQDQVRVALNEASVIIFLVDGQEPLTRVDYELRDELFRFGKPVVLVVNKLDNPNMEVQRHEFHELGMGEPHAISSGHGLGVGEMMEEVVKHLPPASEISEEEIPDEDSRIKVAVVGKPNVGKSSFVNAILNEERTIVDSTPGTTRDAIDIEFDWKDKQYLLIDTAGMRKKAGIQKDVEHFSVARSLRSVRRADVCLILMDATEGISEQDKRIIGYVREQGIAMILVWTKWDLVDDKDARFKELGEDLEFKFPHIGFVPILTISNVSRQRIFKTFEVIERVGEKAAKRIPTGELNRFFETLNQPPTSKRGKAGKIRYVTQSGVKPTVFVLFVNDKSLFHFSYVRYIENQLRQKYGFEGVPIQLEFREGRPQE